MSPLLAAGIARAIIWLIGAAVAASRGRAIVCVGMALASLNGFVYTWTISLGDIPPQWSQALSTLVVATIVCGLITRK